MEEKKTLSGCYNVHNYYKSDNRRKKNKINGRY